MPDKNNNATASGSGNNKKMGLWQVVALAVGASIFSIFGLGARTKS